MRCVIGIDLRWLLLVSVGICGCGPSATQRVVKNAPATIPIVVQENVLDRRLHGPEFALAPGRAELAVIVGDDVLVVDLETGRRETFRMDAYYRLTNIAYSPDGEWLAAMEYGHSNPSRIFILTVEGDVSIESNRGLYSVCRDPDGHAGGLMFSADSKLVISAGDHFDEYWSASDQYPVWSLEGGERSRVQLNKMPKTFRLVGGLVRTEDRMAVTLSGSSGTWTFRPGSAIFQNGFGWLTDRAVGVRTKDRFTILDGRSGKVVGVVELSPGAAERGMSRECLELLK